MAELEKARVEAAAREAEAAQLAAERARLEAEAAIHISTDTIG